MTSSVPQLEDRTLRFSPDRPALEEQHRVCTKKILFICIDSEMQKNIYDLTDPVIRKQLIDMGFVAIVRKKP